MRFTFLFALSLIVQVITHAQTTVVGSTDGVFNVSDLGGATYSIPIKVPKGIGDMQPSLALVYNSQSGNSGIMGSGWSITTGSAVTRTANTIYNDNKVNAVELSGNDKFMLDGGRLILTSGSYGAANSAYRTEVETFKDIIANGTLGNGPASFTVKDQNGWTYEYGTTANSRVLGEGSSTPYQWLLAKVTDLNGNYISYEYSNTPGQEPLLKYMNYAANGNNLSPQSRIVFEYENKPDPNFIYLAGTKVSSSMRLQSIRIQEGANTIRSYNLLYATDFYTHLVKVIERGDESGTVPLEQLPATEFQYGGANVQNIVTQVAPAKPRDGDYFPGDYNGDGKLDYVKLVYDINDRPTEAWELYINNGNGFTLTKSGGTYTSGVPSGTIKITGGSSNPFMSVAKYMNRSGNSFDYDGDGTDEFFTYTMAIAPDGNATTTLRIIKFTDNGTIYKGRISEGLSNLVPYIGDFDGDGRAEILLLNYKKNNGSSNNYIVGEKYGEPVGASGVPDFLGIFTLHTQLSGLTFDAAYVRDKQAMIDVLDYNGDGKSDIMCRWGTYADVYSFDATFNASGSPVLNANAPFKFVYRNLFYPPIDSKLFTGDFNGDGITDVLTWRPGDLWQIGYGKGNGDYDDVHNMVGLANTEDPMPNNAAYTYSLYPVFVGDYNGDGKSDIYIGSKTQNSAQLTYSKGNHTFEQTTSYFSSAVNPWGRGMITPGDFNGDGATDMLFHCMNKSAELFSISPNETRHLIKQITNGFGAATKINYASIVNNASVYSQSGSGIYIYPFVKRPLPMKVVSLVNTDNGINTAGNNITYSYSAFRYHLAGKGALGFEKVATRDEVNGIRNEKNFGLNTTYVFPYLWNASTSQGTTMLSLTSNNYSFYDYGNKRIFPYIMNILNQDYITGIKVLTTNNYNFPSGLVAWGTTYSSHTGKPFSITTDKGSGLEVTTQTFTYPNFSNGLPGSPSLPAYIYTKPSSITTTTTRQGQATYTRKQNFTYNAATGLVSTIVSDPGTSNAVTQSFAYTSYGNVTSITTSATGLPSSTAVTGYDATQRFPVLSYNQAFPDVKKVTTYNVITKAVESTVDPDGFTVKNTYDGLGRLKTSSDNNGALSSTVYGWANASPYAPTTAKYFVQTNTNTAAPSYKYYDRLGRLVRTAYMGFNGTMIYEDVTYNNKGQVATSSKPYFANIAPQWISNSYDTKGRVITEARPEGSITYSYTLNGGQYLTSMTNAAGQVMKTYNDATGRLAKAEDYGGILEYTYHSNGKVKRVALGGNTVSETEYDDFGRQKKATDPNYGSYEYTYNAYDELLSQKDPKGNIYTYTYNDLGEVATKTGPEGAYVYTYNTVAGPNSGKMIKVTGPGGVTQNYSYGMGDKVNFEERILGSEVFKTQHTYDALGRTTETTYPNGILVKYGYNSNDGTLEGAYSPSLPNSPWLYRIKTKDALAHYTSINHNEAFGGVGGTYMVNTTQQYNSYGMLTEQKSLRYNNTLMRHYQYSFQPSTGNLLQRKDARYNLREDFTYDNLNRLTGIQGYVGNTAMPALQTTYANNGNITQKTDAGTLGYDQANRVSEIYPFVNVPTTAQSITYTPFNKVATITEGINKAQFSYWADAERAKMELLENNVLKKTKYYSSDFEKEIDAATSSIRELVYVNTPDGNIAAIIEKKNGIVKPYFVLTDHLGSITHILNDYGNVVEEKSFDAWGRSRNPQTWAALPPTSVSNGWDRGYTGHEHLSMFGIINMNGRLYDPLLGRMMEPDPVLQVPTSSQSYNRYSYVLNNPLKFTDPTGEYIGWDDLIAAIVGGVVNVVCNWNNIGSFGQGFSYFVAGAGSGVATLYGGPMAGGAVLGLSNSAINQYYTTGNIDVGQMAKDGVVSALFSQVGAQMSSGITPAVSNAFSEVGSPVISNMLPQATVSSTTGFTLSYVSALSEGASGKEALNQGVKGFYMGLATGSINGMAQGIMIARSMGRNALTGKPLQPDIEPLANMQPKAIDLNWDGKQARAALRKGWGISAEVDLTSEQIMDNLVEYGMKNKIDLKFGEIRADGGVIKTLEMNGTRYQFRGWSSEGLRTIDINNSSTDKTLWKLRTQ